MSRPPGSVDSDYLPAPGIHANSCQLGAVVFTAVFAPICTTCVVLRFVNFRGSKRRLSWEDYNALIALIFYLAFSACSIYMISILNGRLLPDLPLEEKVFAARVSYAGQPLFPMAQTFARSSVGLLLYRLFWSNRAARVLSKIIMVANWLICIPSFMVTLLLCRPIERFWNSDIDGICIDFGAFLASTESCMSVLDLVMIGLAISMYGQVQSASINRLLVGTLLGAGCFTAVLGFLKIGLYYMFPSFSFMTLNFWNLIQLAAACVCCCLPLAYGHLPQIPLPGPLRHGMSSLTSLFPVGSGSSRTCRCFSEKSKRAAEAEADADADAVSEHYSHRSDGIRFNVGIVGLRSAFDPDDDLEKAPKHRYPNDIYMGGEPPPHLRSTMEQLRAKCVFQKGMLQGGVVYATTATAAAAATVAATATVATTTTAAAAAAATTASGGPELSTAEWPYTMEGPSTAEDVFTAEESGQERNQKIPDI